jgi:hypothetical protein
MGAMSDNRRSAPRGHGAYLTVLGALPPNAATSLRELATLVRRFRRRIRLQRQRFKRGAQRRFRRIVRSAERRMRGPVRRIHRLVVRDPSNDGQALGPLHTGRWERLLRVIVPPTVALPGVGPVVAVDARGLSRSDLASRVQEFPARTIFIVDDPDIGWLRAARLLYEYAPATSAVSADDRLDWITYAYGVDQVVRLSSIAAATDHLPWHDQSEDTIANSR